MVPDAPTAAIPRKNTTSVHHDHGAIEFMAFMIRSMEIERRFINAAAEGDLRIIKKYLSGASNLSGPDAQSLQVLR